jgi:hypothetical protein
MTLNPLTVFQQTILYTGPNGRACFKEEAIPLNQGKPAAVLSEVFTSGGYQLRRSPVGFRSEFHCTGAPQWVFILEGQMEIGVHGDAQSPGGYSRVFGSGSHFFSADLLPEGATFDPAIHGHWSRQVGDQPLTTLFVRV